MISSILSGIIVYIIGIVVNKQNYMGMADVKVFTAMSLAYGFVYALNLMALSFGLLLLISLVRKRDDRAAFIPVITLAFLIFEIYPYAHVF
ncbi:hypothetical protein [Methanococcoides sp. FTZ1]|uniref:hypothetical protein n=1 Tax=Methanococcoides sp. FTZ1 TaxID=3439061 RepID=UPI003F87037A